MRTAKYPVSTAGSVTLDTKIVRKQEWDGKQGLGRDGTVFRLNIRDHKPLDRLLDIYNVTWMAYQISKSRSFRNGKLL
jgi:hypothetical protein